MVVLLKLVLAHLLKINKRVLEARLIQQEEDSLVLTTGIDTQRYLLSMIDQQLKNLRILEDIHMADELELSDFA